MTERLRSIKAEQRQPEPLRIFSGARLNPDGTFVNPAHQALSDLWEHEAAMGRIPGEVRTMFSAGSNVETTRSLRVYPKNRAAEKIIEDTRGRFEQGVKRWIEKGSPPYDNISLFHEAYITPLNIENHDFRGT